MNVAFKHSILALFSLGLVLATLSIPTQVYDEAGLGRVVFGFPVAFVEQDFSEVSSGRIGFFPRYQRASYDMAGIWNGMLWQNAAFSFLITLFFVESLITLLEWLKAFILRRRIAYDNKEDDV